MGFSRKSIIGLLPFLLAGLSLGQTSKDGKITARTAGYGSYGQYYGKSSGNHKKHRNRLLMVKRIKTKHRKSFVK